MPTAPAKACVTRLAMWSGPRNISTAMMRCFGSRADTLVCDEPLYAPYLSATQDKRHPGFEETLASHETDWRRVADRLTGPLPDGKSVFYQKHMAHHLLPGIDRDWIGGLDNCLLIRSPAEVLVSLAEFIPNPRPEDTGLPQQLELMSSLLKQTGRSPAVIDSRDVLLEPEAMLRKLCGHFLLEFDPAMLSWEPGLRDTDGAWAPYWYGKVAKTTGFGPYRERSVDLPVSLRGVWSVCQPIYEQLYAERLS